MQVLTHTMIEVLRGDRASIMTQMILAQMYGVPLTPTMAFDKKRYAITDEQVETELKAFATRTALMHVMGGDANADGWLEAVEVIGTHIRDLADEEQMIEIRAEMDDHFVPLRGIE